MTVSDPHGIRSASQLERLEELQSSTSAAIQPSATTVQYLYLAVVFLASAVCAARLGPSNDTLWHIPTGDWILNHLAVPHADIFSSTRLGTPWVAHEWLSEVFLGASYRPVRLGWGGASVQRRLCLGLRPAGGLPGGQGAACQRAHPADPGICLGARFVHGASAGNGRADHCPVGHEAYGGGGEEGNAEPAAGAADDGVGKSAWVVRHRARARRLDGDGSGGGGAGRRDRLAAGARWGWFALLALLFALITPQGVDGVLFPIHVQRMAVAVQYITEWQPYPVTTPLDPLLLWLLVLIGFAVNGKLRLGWVRLLGISVLLYLTLRYHRHVALLGLLSPVLLATPFCGPKLGAAPRTAAALGLVPGRRRPAGTLRRGAMVLSALAGLMAGAAVRVQPFQPGEGCSVASAIGYAKKAGLTGPVLNEYGYGGALIFNGIPPFIDGRADMYGDDFLEEYFRAVNLTAENSPMPLLQLLDKYAVGWTLFPPSAPVLAVLAIRKDWKRVYSDAEAVIYRRVSLPSGRVQLNTANPHAPLPMSQTVAAIASNPWGSATQSEVIGLRTRK